MRKRRGWATGTVVLVEDGDVGVATLEDVWIELFNGAGRAGVFGGVRFITVTEGDLVEAYAYATPTAFEAAATDTGWYVESYAEDDVDYGPPAPSDQFVVRDDP